LGAALGLRLLNGQLGPVNYQIVVEDIPVLELVKSILRGSIRTPLVLALIHRPVHARFKKGSGRLIGIPAVKFEELINIPLQVPPHERCVAIRVLGCPEFEFFANEENAFFIG
jgi:hypothetical protein